MSVNVLRASSQRLTAPALVTTFPLTFGMWTYPTAVSGGFLTLCMIANASGTGDYLQVLINNAGSTWIIDNPTGFAASSGAAVINQWHYILVRYIAAANTRLSILYPTGVIEHIQNANSYSLAAVTQTVLGAFVDTGSYSDHYSGKIAEFFIANADVQGDGAATQDALVRDLAYQGPFAVPNFAPSIIEYLPFRAAIDTSRDNGEMYFGAKGRNTWTNTNAADLKEQPPLRSDYVRPNKFNRFLMI